MVDLNKSIKGSFFYAQKNGGGTILKFEQMENGYYVFTYESNGITLQRVFAEPKEKVNMNDLKPVENPAFSLEVDI